jgi:hypothetical protein
VTDGEPLGEIRFTLASRRAQRAHKGVQLVWAQTVQLPDGQGGFLRAACLSPKTRPLATSLLNVDC